MSNSTASNTSNHFLALSSSLLVLEYILFYVPTLILSGLYVVALVRAKNINLKMKVLLINNLIPDLLMTLASILSLVMNPVRVYTRGAAFGKVTCVMFFFLVFPAQFGNTLAPTFFAIAVYLFMKYGIKKLKWCPIIGFISISWGTILTATVTHMATSGKLAISTDEGYCTLPSDSAADIDFTTIILLGMALVVVVCVCITVAFAITSYRYVRKATVPHISEGPSPIMRALAKLLVFEACKLFFLLITIIATYVSFFLKPFEGNIFTHLIAVTFGLSTLLAPVMSAVLLKPLDDALKQIFKPLTCCLSRGEVITVQEDAV